MSSDHRARTQAACVLSIVSAVSEASAGGEAADHALARVYRAHREFGSRDRRLFSSLVYAGFRWRGWLDRLGITDPGERVAAAHFLDGLPPAPAVSELAAQTRFRSPPTEPGTAAAFEERGAALCRWAGCPEPLRLEALVPEWADRFIATPAGVAPAAHLRRCITAFQCRPPLWLRLSRAGRARAIAVLAEAGFSPEPHPRIGPAVSLDPAHPVPSGVLAGLAGMAEVQDLASQVVGIVAGPAPGSRWWDVCSGALGKSLHLVEQMDGAGEVVATDIRPSILESGRRRRDQAGASIIRIREWSSDRRSVPEGLFDGVLVDAPCSAIGTWHRNPDARWRTTPADVADRVADQGRLLDLAASRVKGGGVLVYATCTLSAAENDGVVDAFLAAHPEFVGDAFADPLGGGTAEGRVWIWPWAGPCNGMFIARMRRA